MPTLTYVKTQEEIDTELECYILSRLRLSSRDRATFIAHLESRGYRNSDIVRILNAMISNGRLGERQ